MNLPAENLAGDSYPRVTTLGLERYAAAGLEGVDLNLVCDRLRTRSAERIAGYLGLGERGRVVDFPQPARGKL